MILIFFMFGKKLQSYFRLIKSILLFLYLLYYFKYITNLKDTTYQELTKPCLYHLTKMITRKFSNVLKNSKKLLTNKAITNHFKRQMLEKRDIPSDIDAIILCKAEAQDRM